MKKIAILTQPLGRNYGGIMQNYALQLVLSNKGFQCITAAREKEFSYLRKPLSIIKNQTYNRLIGKHRKIFSEKELRYITAETQRFLDTKMNVSKKLYSTKKLRNYFLKESFDIVIVGSDQTWRPRYSPDIYNFYLDFLEGNNAIRKISYASSFGTEEWEYSDEQVARCKSLICQFDAVSVRESSGVKLCNKYFNIEAELVADPTFLLDKEDYVNLFKDLKSERSGLFVYMFSKDGKKEKMVKSIADHLNLAPFINEPHKGLWQVYDFDNLDDHKFPSIESWVKSFYDADFIVTDSFHGTVFSIIFNKPFLTIVNEARGASRFYSLLDMLGLGNRLIKNFEDFDRTILSEPIDYIKVNSMLKSIKEKSMAYIDTNI